MDAYQPDVQGAFDIKLTTSALAALLASGNPALDAVGVRELVIETGETGQRAITRAKARATGPRQVHHRPGGDEDFGLLADAVLEAQEAALAGGGDGDDEWESEGDSDGDDGDDDDGGGGGGSYLGGTTLRPHLGAGASTTRLTTTRTRAEDPIFGIDTQGFIKERLGAMHARGALAGVAQGLNARRQRALMTLMQ